MHVADATVAVLIERLDTVMRQQSELKGMLTAQSAQLGAIPVMQAQLTEHGQKFDRAFNAIRENGERISAVDRTTMLHAWIWKASGAVLFTCVGLIGWGWSQIQKYDAADNALDRRTLIIETKLGISQPVPEGGKE